VNYFLLFGRLKLPQPVSITQGLMGCWHKIVRGLARQPAFTEPDK
jgi:hypothetical protein